MHLSLSYFFNHENQWMPKISNRDWKKLSDVEEKYQTKSSVTKLLDFNHHFQVKCNVSGTTIGAVLG